MSQKQETKTTNHNMMHITRNAVLTGIVAVILIVVMQFSGTFLNVNEFVQRETENPVLESGLMSSVEQLADSIDSMTKIAQKDAVADAYFNALSFRDVISDETLNDTVTDYGNSYVIKVEGDKIIYPDGAMEAPEINADLFTADHGFKDAEPSSEGRYFVAYSHVSGNYYAIKLLYANEYVDHSASLALNDIEKAFDGKAMLLDSVGKPISYNYDLGDVYFCNGESLDEEALQAFLKMHEPYYVMAQSSDNNYTLVLFLSKADAISDALSVGFLVTLVASIIIGAFLVWIVEIKKLILRRSANQIQLRKYHPATLRRKIRTLFVLASVAVLLSGVFSNAIGSLYSVTWDAQNTLSAISNMIYDQQYASQHFVEDAQEHNTSASRKIADALVRNPKMRTRKQLGKFAKMLSANYIMIYDQNGEQILTNSQYINMRIDNSDSSETHELGRVLNGEPLIYLENVTDNVTGLKSDIVGVRIPPLSDESEDNYNCLVVSYKPSSLKGTTPLSDPDDLLMSMVSSYNVFMLLDEDRNIIHFTGRDFYGKNPLDLGMKEDEVRDNFMGEFFLANQKYYGASEEIDGNLYYYMAATSDIYDGSFVFGLGEALLFLIVMLIVSYILLRDYDRIYEEASGTSKVNPEETSEFRDGWFSKLPFFRNVQTPEGRAKTVFNLLSGLCILTVGILSIVSLNGDRRDNLIPYIFSDYWNKGLNLFAFARILFMTCGVIVAWSIISFLIDLGYLLLDTRGVTIAKLVKNVMKYIALLGLLYYSALYLGFNPATLLASIGVIGIAVSLGAKDLSADIFSGISLIFEKALQVGDVVEIDGVKGTVAEVGVRTLTLIGEDNNIKILRNSNINRIFNMSSSNSWCDLEFTISNNVETSALKEMIEKELPEIRKRHDEILSDPELTGIITNDTGSITFGIKAECREANINSVRSIMNYEIRDFLRHKDISLLLK